MGHLILRLHGDVDTRDNPLKKIVIYRLGQRVSSSSGLGRVQRNVVYGTLPILQQTTKDTRGERTSPATALGFHNASGHYLLHQCAVRFH